MGSKGSTSTSSVAIPQDVLNRYNQVNDRAQVTAATPFQQYSQDPSAFVAPITQTQQAGINSTNQYAQSAQPYFDNATGQLISAQQSATPYYGAATQQLGQAQDTGTSYADAATAGLGAAQNSAAQPQQAAQQNYGAALGAADPLQQQAAAGIQNSVAGASPYQGLATALMAGGAQAVDPSQLNSAAINQYMSPYLQTVLQGTSGMLNQNNQQQMAGQLGNAISSGAFGGDRSGIAAANLAQQQQLANAQIYSGILNQGYGQALSTAQQQQQLGLGAAQANRAALQGASQQALAIGNQGYTQGMGAANAQAALGQQQYGQQMGVGQAQQGLGQQLFGQGMTGAQMLASLGQQQYSQGANTASQLGNLGQQIYGTGAATSQGLANLGEGAQSAGLSGAQAQLAAGQTQQQTQQAGLTALYNQFLQQQSYPFQVSQFLANIAEGTGALSGNTTTTNSVNNGIFSDRRLKEDVKPVGETFDGQKIYSFRYKGAPQTEMGLIAQDVEKKHPHAVGLDSGFKTVDYGAATDRAAKRGHFASGGLASAGGIVSQDDYGQGFAAGGTPGFDPGLMQQIMANYQQMYAPLAASRGGLGAGTIVPQPSVPVGELHPAQAPQTASPSAASTVNGLASAGNSIGQLGDKLHLWNYGDNGSAKDRNVDPYDDTSADGARSGGRIGLASGGDVMPYMNDNGLALNIPDDQHKPQLLTANNNPAGGQGQSGVSQIGDLAKTAGSIASLAMMFSDKRLKENIKPVGKTYDGQMVYSYNLKGDHIPRMGLIAQEVEKKHAHAVGSRHGFKAVDYAAATAPSAKRGHFADGGDVSQDETGDIEAPDINPIRELLKKRLQPSNPEPPVFQANEVPDDIRVASAPVTSDAGAINNFARSQTVPNPVIARALASTPVAPPPKGNIAQVSDWIAKAEGTGKNPKSSAQGYGQFLDGTFVPVFKATFPDQANLSASEILAKRGTGVEKPMLQELTAANAKDLAKSGFTPSPGNIYLGHFLGLQGAKSVLGADPDTPISSLFPSSVVAANGTVLKGKTAGDVIGWAANRISRMASAKRAYGGRTGYDDGGEVSALADQDQARKDAEARAIAVATRATQLPDNLDGFLKQDDAPPMPAALPVAPAAPSGLAGGAPVPAAPAPQPSAGLGAVSPLALDPQGNPASSGPLDRPDLLAAPKPRGFFQGLGHGDASSIIPLLSGIGALATTQTNNPLTAIAAALGTGAQAAQAQRDFALKQQHGNAEALNAQANYQGLPLQAQQAKGGFMNARTASASAKMEWLKYAQPLANALHLAGKPDSVLDHQIAEMNSAIAADTGTPSAGAVAPNLGSMDISTPGSQVKTGLALGVAGVPGAANITQVGLNAKDTGRAFDSQGNVINTPGVLQAGAAQQAITGNVDQNLAERKRVNDAANDANNTVQTASQMLGLFRDPKGGYAVLGGPIEGVRTGFNGYLQSIGVPADLANKMSFTNGNNAIEINKLNNSISSAIARGELGSGVTEQEWQAVQRNTPSTQIPAAAATFILEHNIIPKAQNTIALANAVNNLDPAQNNYYDFTRNWQANNPWNGIAPKSPKTGGTTPRPARTAPARGLAPPPVGTVKYGKKFMGGDPSSPSSWVKVP